MQEFDHIQSLWQSHSVEVKISSEEMLVQAKKEVNSIRNKSLLNIAGMLLSFVAVGSLWLFFDFQAWTTHLGIAIFLMAIAVTTLMLYKGHRLISKNDFTTHPHEFLANLKLYQISRFSLYNSLYWIYTIALSMGILLCFIEILAYFETWIQYSVILLTFSWMVFCSTLVRRAVMKREKERIALLIEKFERLGSQFKQQL
jgi:membrane protein YdbS with pleckstrin-like domain